MQTQEIIEKVATILLTKIYNAGGSKLRLTSCQPIQRLWAGYGHICHVKAVEAENGEERSLILKYVAPPKEECERGKPNEGHIRKLLSYQVEQYFYMHLAPLMPPDICIAKGLVSIGPTCPDHIKATTAFLLSDLRELFPVPGGKKETLNPRCVSAALTWLARFHGFWATKVAGFHWDDLVKPPLEHFEANGHEKLPTEPGGVWLNGGYTYLATRSSEYTELCNNTGSEWSSALSQAFSSNLSQRETSIAEAVAKFLSPSTDIQERRRGVGPYLSLIHGDVKSENLFSTVSGDEIAFYDFQYVGLGLGVCDIAKLLTCSVPLNMLIPADQLERSNIKKGELSMAKGEEELLRSYVAMVREASEGGIDYDWDVFVRHWETALVDWLRFQASWGFWGNTEWLESRVRYILGNKSWKSWLQEQIS